MTALVDTSLTPPPYIAAVFSAMMVDAMIIGEDTDKPPPSCVTLLPVKVH